MIGFSSMGRPKCVNPFPMGESQCIATAPSCANKTADNRRLVVCAKGVN